MYAELADRTRRLLALGESVIVDASFASPTQRARALPRRPGRTQTWYSYGAPRQRR